MPTGAGKTLVGLLFAETLAREGHRALVLEPTRILVEQTGEFYARYADVSSSWFHGGAGSPRDTPIVITTPEAALARRLQGFDAVVVDECHHAVGNDPLRRLLESFEGEYRLGLSAHIPLRHRRLIEHLIGPIRVWDWSDPEIRPYVAEWVADVYETPLPPEARRVYDEIEARMLLASGAERSSLRLAALFLARDGPLALKESVKRSKIMQEALADILDDIENLPDVHKLDALIRALDQHDYDRAIVFIDRVSIARIVAERLDAVLLTGKRWGEQDLEAVRGANIVVSTSAGEEGLDIPTADFLAVWSNSPSPLRLVQRRGRVLRRAGRIPKFVAFLVTPGTLDEEAFVSGIYEAKRAGVDVGVLDSLARQVSRLADRILSELYTPMPIDWLSALLGASRRSVARYVRMLCEDGRVVPLYTETGKSYIRADTLRDFASRRPDLFSPVDVDVRFVVSGRKKRSLAPGDFVDRVILRRRRGDAEYVYTLSVGARVTEETLPFLLKHWRTPRVFETWG